MGCIFGTPVVDEMATQRSMECRVKVLCPGEGDFLQSSHQVLSLIAGGIKDANQRPIPGKFRRVELAALTFRMLEKYGTPELLAIWPTPQAIEGTIEVLWLLCPQGSNVNSLNQGVKNRSELAGVPVSAAKAAPVSVTVVAPSVASSEAEAP